VVTDCNHLSRDETDPAIARRLRRLRELAQRGEDLPDGLVVRADTALELVELLADLAALRDAFAHLHEGAHDEQRNLDRPRRIEHGGRHQGAVLGKGEGRLSLSAPT
jgi:hypothetical protein